VALNFNSARNVTDTLHTAVSGNHYFDRSEQLVFESAPMEKDFDLIGAPVVDFNLKIEGIRDADLKLAFFEVTQDSTNLLLSEAEQRLSHVADKRERTLLKQNKVYSFRFDDTSFMAKRIPKGSKIRFVVNLLNIVGFQKNYGSGKDVSAETKKDGMTGKVYLGMDKKHHTAIHLPGKYVMTGKASPIVGHANSQQ
jgi:uncharacterized protein